MDVRAEAADEAEVPQDVARARALVDFLLHQHHTRHHDLLDDESLLYLNPLTLILFASNVV